MSMTYLGIDCAATISASAAKVLKANGISFAGRYLVPQGMYKDLKASEITALHNEGIAILLCWEIEAAAVKGGADRGAKDGARAKALAQQFQVPSGTTIYFACDYGAQPSDYATIEAYIRAAQQACYPYEAGLYGHALLVDYLATAGACKKFWQCVAWSLGRVSQYTSVYQYQWSGGAESKALAAKVGFDVDMDRCNNLEAAGLWLPKPETHWYDDTVAWAKKEGIVTEARPTDYATRAEVMQMFRNYNRRFEEADPKTDSGLLN